jgi:DNA (cytosine-5)-methyltransferase 1
MKLTAVSLFSGAGGMDIGFSQAGIRTVVANEMDKSAFDTYKENHCNVDCLDGDINSYLNDFKDYKNTDIVFGGPPCQGFSVAGNMDINDPRSQLIFSFAKVVENVNPRAFVMENVKSLGKLKKFEDIRNELLSKFEELEYDCNIVLLNAKDFGVPQSRERVFFIGIKRGEGHYCDSAFNKYKLEAPTLREAISHLGPAGSKNNTQVCKAKITIAKNPILRKSPYAGMLFNGQGRPINPDGWSSTLPASMGGNRTPIVDERHLYENKDSWVEKFHTNLMSKNNSIYETPKYLRRLTVDEASLIQTFPKDYKFIGSQSKVYSQIGNAVPAKLAFAVASVVRDSLNKII